MSLAGVLPQPSGPACSVAPDSWRGCWNRPWRAVGLVGAERQVWGQWPWSCLGGDGGVRDPSLSLLFWTPSPGPDQLGPGFPELDSLCPLWLKLWFQLKVRVFGGGRCPS